MSAITTHANETPEPSVNPLRQLKEAEAAWESRLREAKERMEAHQRQLRAESQEALAAARSEAERAYAEEVQSAVTAAEAEAKKILELARFEASKIETLPPGEVEARFPAILRILFGDWVPDAPGTRGANARAPTRP